MDGDVLCGLVTYYIHEWYRQYGTFQNLLNLNQNLVNYKSILVSRMLFISSTFFNSNLPLVFACQFINFNFISILILPILFLISFNFLYSVSFCFLPACILFTGCLG